MQHLTSKLSIMSLATPGGELGVARRRRETVRHNKTGNLHHACPSAEYIASSDCYSLLYFYFINFELNIRALRNISSFCLDIHGGIIKNTSLVQSWISFIALQQHRTEYCPQKIINAESCNLKQTKLRRTYFPEIMHSYTISLSSERLTV